MVPSPHLTVDVQVESSERRGKCLKKLSTEDIASFEAAADLPSKVKTSKSVSFKDCWGGAQCGEWPGIRPAWIKLRL